MIRTVTLLIGRNRVDVRLHVRLAARLHRVFSTGRDFLAPVLLLLPHFLVVRDVAGIGHSCLEFLSAALTSP